MISKTIVKRDRIEIVEQTSQAIDAQENTQLEL